MEQKNAPVPQMKFQPLQVYTVFILTLVCWCYYGYQYNEVHRQISFVALIIFLMVFLVLFVAMMSFREYNRGIRMCPVLKSISDIRPGAFLFIAGKFPTLFYAREGWLGKVVFHKGGENQESTTRLEAVTRRSGGWLSISKKNIISNVFGRSDKDNIPLPDSDFSRKFIMSGTDKVLADELLKSGFTGAIMRLEEFKKPSIEIDGKSVTVEITENFYSTRKEAALRQFLEVAESIVDAVVQQG
jgi:preprotein translocase subunit YajC